MNDALQGCVVILFLKAKLNPPRMMCIGALVLRKRFL
jgi:hypothetical protein